MKAWIFDCDGVVVDSNAMHVETWRQTAAAHGWPMADPEHIGKCGMTTGAVIREVLKWPVGEEEARRLGEEKEERYREMIRAGGIRAIAGVEAFLRRARGEGRRCAMGSSAPRANVEACLDALGLRWAFDCTVSGEDVARGKPEPDIFLKAAEGLGARPEECVVFEDSPAGVEAARRAGMESVAVLTSHTAAELAAAGRIWRDFEDAAAAAFGVGEAERKRGG